MSLHVGTAVLPNLHYYRPPVDPPRPRTLQADVCVYGGTSAGVIAAVQAARLGLSVIVLEFGDHLGGLSSGGLGATDIGNKAAIGGLSRLFYQRLGAHYGEPEAWKFEPGVAEGVFEAFVGEHGIAVHRGERLAEGAGVERSADRLAALQCESGLRVEARMFIDATYEGDLLAAAGVPFHVGREANSVYRETLNGVHFGHPGHNFRAWVDPYVSPGNPSSGLLPFVQDLAPGFQGEGDACVQAYNFRMCLCRRAGNMLAFPKPAGYDADRYELLRRYLDAGIWDAIRLNVMMPNDKTDCNNYGGFSSDHIGANYDWPTGSYQRREEVFQDHVGYLAGMWYFLANDPRVPDAVRREVNGWGLAADEFRATGGWPHQLYIREARRMVSDVVMVEQHCRLLRRVEDSVGLAAYTMDSHNCRRIVLDGRVINEGNVEVPPSAPYSISYRSIVPPSSGPGAVGNLLVPICLSSSHIAYGSIRMEPVFMVLGQSAATAAATALRLGCRVQDVPYAELRSKLLADGQILEWTGA